MGSPYTGRRNQTFRGPGVSRTFSLKIGKYASSSLNSIFHSAPWSCSSLSLAPSFLRNILVLFRPVDWDVFVRVLDRQLRTPSHWLPVDSCKKRTKGRPSGRLHSDTQVSQQETPKLCTSVSEHRVWHSEGLKNGLCIVCIFSFWQTISFPVPCA